MSITATTSFRRALLATTIAALALAGSAVASRAIAAPEGAAVPAAESAARTEDQRLADFFETVFRRNLADSPMFQSQIGIKGKDYGRWDDISEAEAHRQDALNRQDLEQLKGFDTTRLSPQSRTSARIFEYLRRQNVDGFPWRFHNYVFSSTTTPPVYVATFLQNIHRVDEVSDAEAYVSRLRDSERLLGQFVDGIEDAAERGIVPTSFSFDPVVTDSRSLLTGAPFDDSGKDGALLADFRAKVTALKLPEAEAKRLLGAAEDALRGPFRRGVERFVAAVEALRPRSHGPNGVWKLPDGEAYYRQQVRFWTTDDTLTPERIHRIGLDDVARIRGEMEAIMKRVGFQGDLQAFFTHLRTDPANFFPDTDAGRQAYLALSKGYIDSIYADVGRYFNVMPKAPLEVRRVEPWREATAPIAFYEQPAPDGSRPGVYYVNLLDMASMQKHEMETVAYHEGAPGHHFQIAIQQELGSVPQFQKFAFFGAYIEGWGLYAERLAKEEGRFTDPLQDFGRLQNEMLRAARLVVDTGGHAKHWSREQMIDFMLDNNPMTREAATKEVERYLDNPGQALSYKIGMLRILELREQARGRLGERFDIRGFHDAVLGNGALPLPVLAQQVEDYVRNR